MSDVSRRDLVSGFAALGLRRGATVLVHCSLSAIGTVRTAEEVVEALQEVLGPAGTIVVPAQSWHLCDPAYLNISPAEEWDSIRRSLPVYDPDTTPSNTMGLFAEAIRRHPESKRSAHPHRSFAALGSDAADLMADHQLDDPVGEGSPLQALYTADATVVLLGVGYDKCTSLHLAESRHGVAARVDNGAPMLVRGERQWIEFTEPAVDDSDFATIGEVFERELPGSTSVGRVGNAASRAVQMRALVDFAAEWMGRHRV